MIVCHGQGSDQRDGVGLSQAYCCAVSLLIRSLAAQNLAQLLGSCHAAGLVSSDLLYSLLDRLVVRFREEDVQLMVSQAAQLTAVFWYGCWNRHWRL
jgi:hypothetical protein